MPFYIVGFLDATVYLVPVMQFKTFQSQKRPIGNEMMMSNVLSQTSSYADIEGCIIPTTKSLKC